MLPEWIHHAPAEVLIEDGRSSWSPEALSRSFLGLVSALEQSGLARGPVGLFGDNSAHWIAADLAAHVVGACLVPLPSFFSPGQLQHAAKVTGMQALFCAMEETAHALGFSEKVFEDGPLALYRRPRDPEANPMREGIQKVTFTSGTTGTPKGVCLTARQQLQTAAALAAVTSPLGLSRHLNLLPLAVLLENVAGIYAPLIAGATCICPGLDETGLSGASGFDAERCLGAIGRYRPDSVILLPQMLHALVERLARAPGADPRIGSLRFVAVGGARTSAALIVRARAGPSGLRGLWSDGMRVGGGTESARRGQARQRGKATARDRVAPVGGG